MTTEDTPTQTAAAAPAPPPVRSKWRTFAIGLAIRLLGLLLIWAGDGSPHLARQAMVVVGVVLTVGGIAVLRYLLISGFRKK